MIHFRVYAKQFWGVYVYRVVWWLYFVSSVYKWLVTINTVIKREINMYLRAPPTTN